MSPPFFNWPPFKLVALDADTGKPIDPTVGMRVYREFYNVKKDKDGKKIIVMHKTDEEGSKKGIVMTEDKKKNGNGSGSKAAGGGNGESGEEKKEAVGAAGQKPADVEWTTAEDVKLKAMKADGKGWKPIIAELGRSKNDIRERWNKIGPGEGTGGAKKDEGNKDKSGDGNGGGKKGNKKEDKKGKKAERPSNGEKKSEHKTSAKAPIKAPSKAPSGEARFTMGEWMTLQEDDLFSFGELQCLSELIMRDERERWLRISSVFADKTGRRVHPDDIREKFEEIGRMG